ncbi:MAG: hypothetical protein AAFZ01_10445, partial [Pseudomonadota bacterium]
MALRVDRQACSNVVVQTAEPDAGATSDVLPLPPRLPALIILHQEKSTPGRIGHWLRTNGFPLDIRRPRFGDPLPTTLADHSCAVIFGGPMSANDPDDFIRLETDWIDVPLREKKPFPGDSALCGRLSQRRAQRSH